MLFHLTLCIKQFYCILKLQFCQLYRRLTKLVLETMVNDDSFQVIAKVIFQSTCLIHFDEVHAIYKLF